MNSAWTVWVVGKLQGYGKNQVPVLDTFHFCVDSEQVKTHVGPFRHSTFHGLTLLSCSGRLAKLIYSSVDVLVRRHPVIPLCLALKNELRERRSRHQSTTIDLPFP
ncbi:hypothetical protein V3C99_014645 [Haemonchus contortus]